MSKVAIVTGGASGIGRACVEQFLSSGYRVLYTDVSKQDGEETLARLREAGQVQVSGTGVHGAAGPEADVPGADVPGAAVPADVQFVHGDICDPGHQAALVEEALERWQRIDVLVANAGVQTGGRLLDVDDEHWKNVLAVNLLAVAASCRSVLPTMIRQGRGAIVVISSINATLGFRGMAAYDASKAGVVATMRHIAVEHGRDGVRANAVAPGATITDYHLRRAAAAGVDGAALRARMSNYGLLGRAAEPVEIASVVGFLASDAASFVTGQTILVDGGYSAMGERA